MILRRGRGRPRKEGSDRAVGGVWPGPDGVCRARCDAKLALCARHAEILSDAAGHCLWPGCDQSSFSSLCSYHMKIVYRLIDAPRDPVTH
jgi:hypothetical protein